MDLLNEEVGGPSVKPYQPEGIWEETTGGGGGSTCNLRAKLKVKICIRKSLYTFWKRTVPPPSMMTFDASSRDLMYRKAPRDQHATCRHLVLLNDPQLIEAARALAIQSHSDASGKEPLSDQIRLCIFKSATSRKPNEEELENLT